MVKRQAQAPRGAKAPSSWVVRHAARVPGRPGTVLDLAAGGGRHSRHFLALGYSVLALDRETSGLADLAARDDFEVLRADLEAGPWPLGARRFSGIVVTNYLWRPILPDIVAALSPGGVLIYETFAAGNERFGKPRNPDFLLRPGELERAVAGRLEILAYEEGEVRDPRPAVVQRICARRPEPV